MEEYIILSCLSYRQTSGSSGVQSTPEVTTDPNQNVNAYRGELSGLSADSRYSNLYGESM